METGPAADMEGLHAPCTEHSHPQHPLDQIVFRCLHLGRAAGPQCRMDRLPLGRALIDATCEGPLLCARSLVSLLSALGRLSLLGSLAWHSCRLVLLLHSCPRTWAWP